MLIQDVRDIKQTQEKILASVGPLTQAIDVASQSAAAAAASCNGARDILQQIAATLATMATVQKAMAADLAAIKAELIPPPPDTTPTGIEVETGKPVERP